LAIPFLIAFPVKCGLEFRKGGAYDPSYNGVVDIKLAVGGSTMGSNRPVFHPPLEADALFLRSTTGCSYNQCAFCGTYRDTPFRIRKYDELKAEVDKVCQRYQDEVRRIFLGDGDALVTDAKLLRKELRLFRDSFPNLQNVSIYATAQSILDHTDQDLAGLKKAGLDSIYIGIESGLDKVLKRLNKGITAEGILKAAGKANRAGFKLATLVILGAGGRREWRGHAVSTAELLNHVNPHTIIMLTLVLIPNTPLFDATRRGQFTPPTPVESVLELKELIFGLEVDDTQFKSNHSSNYLKVSGVLSRDKESMLHQLERALNNPTEEFFNPEFFRGA
jgi:radical SAM superfamily enzyme YgiQ (UPF0313 family)